MKNFNTFERYGTRIERVKLDDMELLRSWRNMPRIANQMKYQNGKEITSDEQIAWFNRIKDKNDEFHYIAFRDGIAGGSISIKNINWQEKSGEPGGFSIYNTCELDPKVLYLSTFNNYDFFFEVLGLTTLFIEIKSSNKQAIRFNKLLGYEACNKNNDDKFLSFKLEKKDYLKKRDEILKVIL